MKELKKTDLPFNFPENLVYSETLDPFPLTKILDYTPLGASMRYILLKIRNFKEGTAEERD